MMVRLLLYGYCVGVMSSRRMERASYEDVAVRYLCADQHPDHDTIATFRQQHLPVLAQLFTQVLNSEPLKAIERAWPQPESSTRLVNEPLHFVKLKKAVPGSGAAFCSGSVYS